MRRPRSDSGRQRKVQRGRSLPERLLQGKRDRLDWQRFHFLENLLVYCPHPSRSVPAESGVYFHLRPPEPGHALCLLFHIDRKEDPIIRQGPRPDFAAFYLRADLQLCTIIEMKGRDKGELGHGVEQIKALRDRLRQEIGNHLPTRFSARLKFQGILLHPPNADVPRKLIEAEHRHGLTIRPVQSVHSEDLSDLISRPFTLTSERPRRGRAPTAPQDPWNVIERVLTFNALPDRIDDGFYREHFSCAAPREGLYLNHAVKAAAYMAWTASRSRSLVRIIAGHAEQEARAMVAWLAAAGMRPETWLAHIEGE